MSSMMAAQYHLQLNVTPIWDFAHGCCRDLEGVFTALHKWPFVILMMVVMNLAHGPEKDEHLRWHQIKESLDDYIAKFGPHNAVLFKRRAGKMLEELGADVRVGEGETCEEVLWKYLQDNHPYKNRREKVKKCQFMSFLRRSRVVSKEWTAMLFCTELVGLEGDFLGGESIVQEDPREGPAR